MNTKLLSWRLFFGRPAAALVGIVMLCVSSSAQAQFLGFAVGRQLSGTLSGASGSGTVGGPDRSRFDGGALFSLDAGFPVAFPYVTGGLHYSFERDELELRRGDSIGSRADVDLSAHNITFDLRLRTPFVKKFRLFALAGAGFSRFGVDVGQVVESPFPGGAPERIISPVFTYGGGMERHLRQLLHLRLEVRDYVAPVPDELFRPGGAWHRVVILGGITVGL